MEFLHPAIWHDHHIDFARWLHPAMWHVALESWQWRSDQFAYRPTCSTTAALVALEHYVAQYLESASFVQCLSIDNSKAFDTISLFILFQKLLGLNLLPNYHLPDLQLPDWSHSLSFSWRMFFRLETYYSQLLYKDLELDLVCSLFTLWTWNHFQPLIWF